MAECAAHSPRGAYLVPCSYMQILAGPLLFSKLEIERRGSFKTESPSPACLNYRYGGVEPDGQPNSLPRARLPRSGNLHQRTKGFCGPDSEFRFQGTSMEVEKRYQQAAACTPSFSILGRPWTSLQPSPASSPALG
ncbi:hypothetical protein Bbelb_411450 [Branchiostoma belcheri]|nr:hypothetical protein Bbelb_411450 [Branchiostoma belcheri]